MKEFEHRVKRMEYKCLDQEARGRRNNLLFWGIPEGRDENVRQLVYDVIHDDMEQSLEMPFIMQRVHRLGRKRQAKKGEQLKPRAIIACFRDSDDVETIIEGAQQLAELGKSVSRDYPYEINEARKALWPKYKELKKDTRKTVKMKYPARLIVNGVVVEDGFPNWHYVMQGKAMSDLTDDRATDYIKKANFNPWEAPKHHGDEHGGFPPLTAHAELNSNLTVVSQAVRNDNSAGESHDEHMEDRQNETDSNKDGELSDQQSI